MRSLPVGWDKDTFWYYNTGSGSEQGENGEKQQKPSPREGFRCEVDKLLLKFLVCVVILALYIKAC